MTPELLGNSRILNNFGYLLLDMLLIAFDGTCGHICYTKI